MSERERERGEGEEDSSDGGEKWDAERGPTESVHDLALSQVCTAGGAERKEAVHTQAAPAWACVRWCVCLCVCLGVRGRCMSECVEQPNWPPVFPSL